MQLLACRKVLPFTPGGRSRPILKMLLIMKLTAILTLAFCLQIHATGIAQNITLSTSNTPLKKVLKYLQAQSGYSFFFEDQLLQKSSPVSIKLKNVPLEEALELIFKDQPLTYERIGGKLIAIKERESRPFVPPLTVAFADTTITGRVTSDSGFAMKGVTVTLAGSPGGAHSITDDDGHYAIKVPGKDASLVFSYVSYSNVVHRVGDDKVINIVMQLKPSQLDVVVIGYGQVNKKDLTGSVGQVNMKDLSKAPVRSFDEALAGRIAGVQVSSSDGQPGAAYNIIIRGNNSLTQDNSPLYVIDGFPIENPNNNAIDPNDIESIDVLKDASATAIYGARGANGVIIITTKKGKAGKPVVTYNGSLGTQENLKKVALMGPYDFVKLQLELSPAYTTPMYLNNGKTLDSYKTVKGTDWQDEIFQRGIMQNHYLSLTGGNAATRYSLSGSVLNQDGIILNSGMDRYQGRFSLDQTINDKVKVGINAAYSYIKTFGTVPALTSYISSTNLMYSVWGYRPVSGYDTVNLDELGYDPSVSTASDNRYNPLQTVKNEFRQAITNNLMANAYLEYAITRNLTLRLTGGINNTVLRNEAFNGSHTRSGDPAISSTGPNGSIINNPVNNWVNENTLSYKRAFNKDNVLNVVAGFTMQEVTTKRYGMSAIQLPNESLGLSGLDEGTPQTITAANSNNTLASLLGRVNYNFKSRYLFTASFRADGSSKFAPGNKWSYFPSGAFAWRMSNENFMKRLTVVSDAKLRITYGLTGNNRVSDFPYLSQLNLIPAVDYSFNNQTPSTGIYPVSLGNRDLKWETSSLADIGYDLGLFNDGITLTADVYRKTTSNLLLNAQIPTTTGYANAFKNVGKIQNQGLELSLGARIISHKDFGWNASFNISFNQSKTLALNDGQEALLSAVSWDQSYNPNFLYIAKKYQPIAQLYGYVWQGNYQYSDFDQNPDRSYVLKNNVAANGNARNTIQPGDIKYRDLNGDGTITPLDATVIGHPLPIHTGGFTNNFRYKGLDLGIFFQWSYGNDLFNANRLIFEGVPITLLNQFASYAKRWEPDNPNNTLFRAGGSGPRGFAYSTRLVEDGSYLRLKTVNLGYALPQDLLKRYKIKAFRIYLAAQNLWTWTNYSGPDPEVSTKLSALTPGFDYSAYPRARTMTAGVNLSF